MSVFHSVNPTTSAKALTEKFIRPLLNEARALGLSDAELTRLIDQESTDGPGVTSRPVSAASKS